MHHWSICIVLALVSCSYAPPVKKGPEPQKADPLYWKKAGYQHYLSEIMTELEKDKDFRKKAEQFSNLMENGTVKTMDLATQLSFVKHSVRTRLDELKRMELKRLSELERRLDILKAKRGDKDVPEEVQRMADKTHIDHENPSSFEIDDLDKLIKRAIDDLKGIDEKQHEEFKKHEMQKELEHRRKLKHIKGEKEKKEEEKKWQDSQARHNKHEKIHTPGSEAQLKEVWEKEDHMDPNSFNAKTFFKMHDLNEDGELDESEIEAIFNKELDKAYDPDDPDDDDQERYESMMEMRKNIMAKVDTNKDLRISFDELEKWTKSPDFQKDPGFQLPEENKGKIYSEDDLKKFQKDYDQEHPDEDEEEHHEDAGHPGDHQPDHVKDPNRKKEHHEDSGHPGEPQMHQGKDSNKKDVL